MRSATMSCWFQGVHVAIGSGCFSVQFVGIDDVPAGSSSVWGFECGSGCRSLEREQWLRAVLKPDRDAVGLSLEVFALMRRGSFEEILDLLLVRRCERPVFRRRRAAADESAKRSSVCGRSSSTQPRSQGATSGRPVCVSSEVIDQASTSARLSAGAAVPASSPPRSPPSALHHFARPRRERATRRGWRRRRHRSAAAFRSRFSRRMPSCARCSGGGRSAASLTVAVAPEQV